MRDRVVTPDTLAFFMAFPKVVTELLKKPTTIPFQYYTSPSTYYEVGKGFLPFVEFPTMPRLTEVNISKADEQLLGDFRKMYVYGVRQLSIRQQNTKSKAGTLPLAAYASRPKKAVKLAFDKMMTGETASWQANKGIL